MSRDMNYKNTFCILCLLRVSRASRRYREKGTGRGSTRRVAIYLSIVSTYQVGKGYEDEVKFKAGGLRSQVTSVMQASRRTNERCR
ncbi:hypothetical protein BHYA_0354g00070 [Botrytis hyacinthi]|uniref:Uncharacterized protein n=1 Tax=Botrytis hyacinthi TaxID=278943 RepID=A0A4Z1GDG2_9HELO|nr:hypothetical protein BHYA_0354g00070 [Botrytis hyacinthi]